MRPCRHLRPFITRARRVSVSVASCFSALHLAASCLLLAVTQPASIQSLGRSQTAERNISIVSTSISISIGISTANANSNYLHTALPRKDLCPCHAMPCHAMSCRGVPSFRSSLALYRVNESQAADDWINFSSCLDVSLAPIATASAISTCEVETSLEQQVPGCMIVSRQALCQSLEDGAVIGSRPGPSQQISTRL